MNKVILMGRLTKDPEVRYGQGANSTAVSSISLAVDRRFKREGDPDADFFNVKSFGKQAEFVEKYLKKGTKVVISGEIRNNNYTNKDGVKVYATEIITETIEFAESKKDGAQGGTQGGAAQAQPQGSPATPAEIPSGFDMPVDDLPFA